MIKNIVIGILVVTCLTLFFFGLTQRASVEKFRNEAVQSAERAARNAEEAQLQQKLAAANAREAHRQLLIAEQNLLECTQTKKMRKP